MFLFLNSRRRQSGVVPADDVQVFDADYSSIWGGAEFYSAYGDTQSSSDFTFANSPPVAGESKLRLGTLTHNLSGEVVAYGFSQEGSIYKSYQEWVKPKIRYQKVTIIVIGPGDAGKVGNYGNSGGDTSGYGGDSGARHIWTGSFSAMADTEQVLVGQGGEAERPTYIEGSIDPIVRSSTPSIITRSGRIQPEDIPTNMGTGRYIGAHHSTFVGGFYPPSDSDDGVPWIHEGVDRGSKRQPGGDGGRHDSVTGEAQEGEPGAGGGSPKGHNRKGADGGIGPDVPAAVRGLFTGGNPPPVRSGEAPLSPGDPVVGSRGGGGASGSSTDYNGSDQSKLFASGYGGDGGYPGGGGGGGGWRNWWHPVTFSGGLESAPLQSGGWGGDGADGVIVVICSMT